MNPEGQVERWRQERVPGVEEVGRQWARVANGAGEIALGWLLRALVIEEWSLHLNH